MAGLRRLRLLLASIGILAVGFGTAIAATFDGAPATPTPVKDTAAYSDLDVQVHSRDSSTWYALETQNAQHGADCSAPPATHPNTSYAGAVFQCANHVMTAISAGGYGVIYLTPNQFRLEGGQVNNLRITGVPNGAFDLDYYPVWE